MHKRLAFFLHCWSEDWHLAKRIIGQIKRHEPDADILVIGDGVDISLFRNDPDIKFLAGERLKLLSCVEKFFKRAYQFLLENSSARCFVQVDPDTCLHRSLSLPADLCFGTCKQPDGRWQYPLPLGGGLGFCRSLIEVLARSDYFQDPWFSCSDFAYQRFGEYKHAHEEEISGCILSRDKVLGVVLYRLGVDIRPWVTTSIKFRGQPDLKKSLTHPHPIAEGRKIFVLGGHTGTNSTRSAIAHLGWNLLQIPMRIENIQGYEGACDKPLFAWYEELDRLYPDATWILTERDPDEWLAAVRRYYSVRPLNPQRKKRLNAAYGKGFADYGIEGFNKEGYQAANSRVKAYFGSRLQVF